MHAAVRSHPIDIHPLQLEQRDLRVQASGEADEATVGSDDAVAWDDDGNRIGPDGLTYGTSLVGSSQLLGDLAVGGHVAVLDGLEALVHVTLEVRGDVPEVQLQVEDTELLVEVRLDLADGLAKLGGPVGGRVSVAFLGQGAELDSPDASS